jgi:hypothetical protein
MQKREAKLTTQFKKYLKHASLAIGNCAIEMKVTTGKSISFDAVQEHQMLALEQSRQQFVYKIPDDSRGAKPFDMFILQNASAFIGVSFLVPRQTPVVYLVPIAQWKSLAESCGRKSVTEEMLQGIPRVLRLVLSTKH